jgi:hypothetical protein
MPRLSLTDFLDIVSKSGTPKATKVAQVKRRPSYDPRTDFYKAARECIVETHSRNTSKQHLDLMLAGLTDPKKISGYPELVSRYKSWWGRKRLEWFSPPSGVYSAHGIDVNINPELGLRINGTPHVIKLYFKGDNLAKNRCDIITPLLEVALRDTSVQDAVMAVLDIRRSKLFRTPHRVQILAQCWMPS